MKKIFLLLIVFFFFLLPVQALVIINDDIQKDEVRLENITDDEQSPSSDIVGEQIRSFNSDITITKEGEINVRETIVYDFSTLEKHGIYRYIPYVKTNLDKKRYKMTFSNISVIDENQRPYNFTQSDDGEKVSLKIGDANRLITGIHEYIISYKVTGALTYFSDHDELYWNTTGNDWTIPIAKATASINLPENLDQSNVKITCFAGYRGDELTLCKNNYQSGRVEITADEPLYPGKGLTAVIGIPKNIVAVLLPKLIVNFWDTIIGKIVIFLFSLLALTWYIFLPFYIIYRWIKFGRDPKSVIGVTTAWFDPPKTQDGKRSLTPGEIGTLGDETVDMKDISATIVDLARRGYLIIDQRKKGDFYLVRRSPTKRDEGGVILPFENVILTKFFNEKKEIRIKDKNLVDEVAELKNKLYDQVVEDKLFDKNPQTTRTKFYVLAGLAMFTGNIFLAIIAFIFGRVMPRKTVFGSEAKNISFSLRNFLTSQKRQLEFQADKQMMFEKLLPFAVAFGVERIWAKRFESLNIAQPSWYQSYSTSNFNSMLLVNSLNSSFSSVSSVATPTTSSTGHSSGFSGGFSGGGGGGGGGGSW